MTTLMRASEEARRYLDAIKALGVLPDATWEARVSARRQRMALQVGRDGVIVLALPVGTPIAAVTAFVTSHSRKLATVVARQQARPAPTPHSVGKRLVDGETFELFGRTYLLQLGGTAIHTSHPSTGPAMLHLPARLARDARALVAWYCATGLDWIRAEAPEGEQHLSLRVPPTYHVRDLGRRRLGIYEVRRHAVTLHWPVFQLPPKLVRCALQHEQVHATRPAGTPHGPGFRARFDAVLPGNRALEGEARIAAEALWRGTVLP